MCFFAGRGRDFLLFVSTLDKRTLLVLLVLVGCWASSSFSLFSTTPPPSNCEGGQFGGGSVKTDHASQRGVSLCAVENHATVVVCTGRESALKLFEGGEYAIKVLVQLPPVCFDGLFQCYHIVNVTTDKWRNGHDVLCSIEHARVVSN